MEEERQYTCFTIGHSDLPVEAFLYYLQKAGVDCVIDVRSIPFSRYTPQYNQNNIARFLREREIAYRAMGDAIGGRYSDPALLSPEGVVDYQKVGETSRFQDGLNEVISILQSGKHVALMCSEKDPLKCHRFYLISRNLQKKGVKVVHLIPELTRKDNNQLESEMILGEEPNGQCQLFDDQEERLNSAYVSFNKKIGYRHQSEKPETEQKGSQLTLF